MQYYFAVLKVTATAVERGISEGDIGTEQRTSSSERDTGTAVKRSFIETEILK
jgi:hypothetical protein